MMNYYQNQPPGMMDEMKRFFRSGSILSMLIIANGAVWLIIQALKVLVFLSGSPDQGSAISWVTHAFAIPAFIPDLIVRPWTIISYMFLHVDIWHILFNMLWLFWFGKIFLEYLSEKKLITVYLLGGISGAFAYVLAFNIFPVFASLIPVSVALGASASVMAIVTAISFYVPNYSIRLLFLGNIRIVYLAIALFVFDFFMIPSGNAGGHVAHIGGAIFGFVYAQTLRAGKTASTNRQSVPGWFQWLKEKFSGSGKRPRMNTTFNSGQRPVSDEEYNIRKMEKQKQIDEILEKISKGGYDSLTRDEKEILFKTSGKR